MRCTLLVLPLSLLAAEAMAKCKRNGETCHWDDYCSMWQNSAIGYYDRRDDETVRQVTDLYSAYTLYSEGKISKECYNDYGWGCITGWKRLWCR